jgi:hypothetical protein
MEEGGREGGMMCLSDLTIIMSRCVACLLLSPLSLYLLIIIISLIIIPGPGAAWRTGASA